MTDFDRLADKLNAALWYAKGSHTLEDVKSDIDSGAAQLWSGEESVIVTQIVDTPQQRELHFWLAAGTLDELERMYPVVEQFGRIAGCRVCKMLGRPGWARTWLTRDAGWEPVGVVYAKEMT
jgi:hypothetical protein